jgi:predicted chitinase
VQLTWKSNYQKYSTILNADLVNFPEKACDPNVALFILVHGFKTGAFTGRRLEQYVRQGKTDFYNARRCINGLDRATQIGKLAEQYL